MADSAYVAGLGLLARRELSTAQVRQRLARRGHEPGDIDEAVARLTRDGSLDDARVAGAIARSQLSIKKRGQRRVRREIEAAGIAPALAEAAVAEAFADVDGDALLASAIDRRLGAGALADPRVFARIYRYLIAQGFDQDRALSALKARRRSSSS